MPADSDLASGQSNNMYPTPLERLDEDWSTVVWYVVRPDILTAAGILNPFSHPPPRRLSMPVAPKASILLYVVADHVICIRSVWSACRKTGVNGLVHKGGGEGVVGYREGVRCTEGE